MKVLRQRGNPGTNVEEFKLTGQGADGKSFTSDSVSTTATRINENGYQIRVTARVATITGSLGEAVERPTLRLWFRSFKSFRNPPVDTTLGKLLVHGEAQSVSHDDMSGSVALVAPTQDPGPNWHEDADEFLAHMHQGLAFAHGGRLQTPRLDYVHGQTAEATFYEGEGFKPEMAVLPHLNHGPFIRALAERYENKGPLRDKLWTALGWMQIDTTFDEIRFLSAMTALESIIDSELPERRGTIVAKKEFIPLRQEIERVVEADSTLAESPKEILKAKVSQLNQKTLSMKIQALFPHYKIPKRDFDDAVIRGLIELRNTIVHKGTGPDGVDIWPSIILARELVTRILLKEIGFHGHYYCYVGGRHDREFP